MALDRSAVCVVIIALFMSLRQLVSAVPVVTDSPGLDNTRAYIDPTSTVTLGLENYTTTIAYGTRSLFTTPKEALCESTVAMYGTPEITELEPNSSGKHLELICPGSKPERFLSLTWYVVTPQSVLRGLYHVDNHELHTYRDHEFVTRMNVTHNVTKDNTLTIQGDTCDHKAHYQCRRSALVGYANELYEFLWLIAP